MGGGGYLEPLLVEALGHAQLEVLALGLLARGAVPARGGGGRRLRRRRADALVSPPMTLQPINIPRLNLIKLFII